MANILTTEITIDFRNQKPSAQDYVITNNNFRAVKNEIEIYEFPNCKMNKLFEKRSFSAQKLLAKS